jgi:hypothetical protein
VAARTALEGGDTEKAAQALAVVLSIDPRHPAAGELSAALNRHFRGRAEDARAVARKSRAEAEAGRAGRMEGFAEAAQAVADADALFQREEFAVAAQKYLESRDGFDRARRAAEVAARATPTPRPTSPPTTAVAQALPPATLAPFKPPVTTPPVTPTAPPSLATATPPPTPAAPSAESLIRKVIADYGRAIEGKDLALFKAVKPNLSADDAERLEAAFKAIKSQEVGIRIQSVQVDGSHATVQVARQDTINGRPMKPTSQVFRLVLGPGGWTIDSIGQ